MACLRTAMSIAIIAIDWRPVLVNLGDGGSPIVGVCPLRNAL